MRIPSYCLAATCLLALTSTLSAQDRGVNLGDKIPAVGNGTGAKIPAGALPWYRAMSKSNNRSVQNPVAAMQAQQMQAQAAMLQQQAAIAAKKAQEKQQKKDQRNAVNAKKRAEELSERGTGASKP